MPPQSRASAIAVAVIAMGLSSGCAATTADSSPVPERRPTVTPETPPPAPAAYASFAEWQAAFRTRASAKGIRPDVFDAAFAGVRPNPKVIELDSFQPEFTRPIWEYLDSAVSQGRIRTGRAKLAEKTSALADIEARFNVDRAAIVAIWGLESAYGANYGSMSVIRSLSTLAYQGRRKQWAEDQLVAALEIIQSGDITPGRMVGSWAGAMGHTQFIPTSFLDYAVDATGDGRRDLWAADAIDALASTGNYLARFGWARGAPAVVEITLPAGFDYLSADDAIRRSAAEWEATGIRPAAGGSLPPSNGISILLPAGAQGPAFAAYPNFRVIKRYNNATSYALAVAHLAERIEGGGPFIGAWPRGDRGLSRTEASELQQLLTARGYDTQGVDGIIGPNTRNAVRRYQADTGTVPDGYVSASLLNGLRANGG